MVWAQAVCCPYNCPEPVDMGFFWEMSSLHTVMSLPCRSSIILYCSIRNLEPNCQYSSCSSCSSYSEIVAKSLQPPQNLCRPLKTFTCASLMYRKCHGGVTILVVVCGKICGKIFGKICDKICGKMCGKIDFFLLEQK